MTASDLRVLLRGKPLDPRFLMLEHEKGSMDLTVLAHTHNLLPFAGNSTVQAEAEDIKNFFRTVLRPEDKLMCIKKDDRMVVRNLIMKVNETLMSKVLSND